MDQVADQQEPLPPALNQVVSAADRVAVARDRPHPWHQFDIFERPVVPGSTIRSYRCYRALKRNSSSLLVWVGSN
jgi:hypothetical protein